MRRAAWWVLPLVLVAGIAHASEFPAPLQGHEGSATADGAAGVVYNPALVGLRYPSEFIFGYTHDDQGKDIAWDAWGAWRSLGFRATLLPDVEQRVGFTLAGGGPGLRFGWSGEWVGPDLAAPTSFDHRVGLVSRPVPWISLAVTTDHLFRESGPDGVEDRVYTFGLALRPAASKPAAAFLLGPRLTLRGDLTVPEIARPKPGWRAGLDAEIASGIALRLSFDDDQRTQVGLAFRLPGTTVAANLAPKAKDLDTPVILPWGEVESVGLRPPQGYASYSVSFHSGEEPTVLAPRSMSRVARIRVAGVLGDEGMSSFSLLGGGVESESETGALHAQFRRALEDPLTRGVLLELNGAANMAALEELRPRIAALRAAGKPVVAYLEEGGGRGDLFLASACDRVFASEEAMFWQLGLRSERRYYRSLLERWGVRFDRSSIGRYKSAYRNYSVDSTTDADREVIEHVLDQVQANFTAAVASGRGIAPERFVQVLDGRDWPTTDLVSAGLVDSVGYREQALAEAGRLARLGTRPAVKSLHQDPAATRAWRIPSGVAVVYASGGIESGESGNDLLNGPTLGASTLIRDLDRAFHAPGVRAVVFRIESPGGSALASNLIYHELDRLQRETRKPLAVSMGSVAASGGYYIAVPARRIFADKSTRTGSIGVVFLHPSLEGWYAKHGVRQDEFQRGAYMRGSSLARDWDAASQASADSAIARSYDTFVNKVAYGRNLSRERVLQVAQGRVWLGEDARERGLVDEIGGLDAAIRWARNEAGLDPNERFEPLEFRRPAPGLFQRIASGWLRAQVSREAQIHDISGTRFEADDDFAF